MLLNHHTNTPSREARRDSSHSQTWLETGEVCGYKPEARGRTVLELELIQPHMAQKPVLRGEVGCACVAREVSVERGGMGERGCARRLGGWGAPYVSYE